jgi:hypothetical protein
MDAADERLRRLGSTMRIIHAAETTNCPRRRRPVQLRQPGPVRLETVIDVSSARPGTAAW